ncbi:MAG: hypothetical protein QOE59_3658 [Actinomycetota bacterium]|nr:hypothetical protein [Actinomycetota bacterium]
MTGLPFAMRLAGYGVRAPATRVRGREVAGRVEAVGANVTRFACGDEVFGVGEGCFAEYARASQNKLAPRPAALTVEQAAATTVSALTALQAVRDRGHVEPGQLVIGASGGVGTFAVQIAKVFGAEVTGVCSTSKVDLVQALGADHVLDYTRTDITGSGITGGAQRYDVILDIGGNRSLAQLRRGLGARGTLVMVGGEGGGRWLGIGRQLQALALSPFLAQQLRSVLCSENAADLRVLADLIECGAVTPAIDRTYPLSETPAAIAHMAGGNARGKVVVTV